MRWFVGYSGREWPPGHTAAPRACGTNPMLDGLPPRYAVSRPGAADRWVRDPTRVGGRRRGRARGSARGTCESLRGPGRRRARTWCKRTADKSARPDPCRASLTSPNRSEFHHLATVATVGAAFVRRAAYQGCRVVWAVGHRRGRAESRPWLAHRSHRPRMPRMAWSRARVVPFGRAQGGRARDNNAWGLGAGRGRPCCDGANLARALRNSEPRESAEGIRWTRGAPSTPSARECDGSFCPRDA